MDISSRIKLLREEAKLSQGELARRARIAQSSLSYLESGSKSPSVDTLLQICGALGISLSEFLGENNDEQMPLHIKYLLNHVISLTPEQVLPLTEFIRKMKGE